MLVGAMIAASDDLTFNWFGYIFLLMNNFCTAAQGVVIKQKLVNKVRIDLVVLVVFFPIYIFERMNKTVGGNE